jgi:hypothetical protein
MKPNAHAVFGFGISSNLVGSTGISAAKGSSLPRLGQRAETDKTTQIQAIKAKRVLLRRIHLFLYRVRAFSTFRERQRTFRISPIQLGLKP